MTKFYNNLTHERYLRCFSGILKKWFLKTPKSAKHQMVKCFAEPWVYIDGTWTICRSLEKGLRVPQSTWFQKRVYSEQPTCGTDKCDRANVRFILDLQIVRGIFSNSKIFLTKFSLKVGHFAHFGHFGPSKRVYSREVNIMTCSVLLGL